MARHEQDREDLLAQATALVERIELSIPAEAEPVIVGFRRGGEASFYFGPDVAFQFNSQSKLRRAHFHGRLFKAESGRLVSLDRHRREGAVELARHDLTADETATFLTDLSLRLERLDAALAGGEFQTIGQVPSGVDLVGRIRAWLTAAPRPVSLAAAPGVR